MTDRTVNSDELDSKLRDLRTLLKEDVMEMRTDIRDRIDGIVEGLATLNGRTGKSELKIAVLEDRSERAEVSAQRASDAAIAAATSAATAAATAASTAATSHKDAKNAGIGWGAGAGASVYGLWQLAEFLIKKMAQP
jgi:hypothetical protein